MYADWQFYMSAMLQKLFLVKTVAILDKILDFEKRDHIWERHPNFSEGSWYV